jgi:hypothetical protein
VVKRAISQTKGTKAKWAKLTIDGAPADSSKRGKKAEANANKTRLGVLK